MPFGQKLRLWTEEERETVMAMLDGGATASDIAEIFAISRNAAIGRISRDHVLHEHVQFHVHVVRKPVFSPKKSGRPGKPPVEDDMPAQKLPPRRMVPLVDLGPNECRWPVRADASVPGQHLFCGRQTLPGESYCAHHKRLARPGGS